MKAMEQNREDRIFLQWAIQLPSMGASDSYMSFADYKARVTGSNIDRRSTDDLLADIDAAERELQGGGE